MDDDKRFELEQQYEAEQLREYRRGLKMLEQNPTRKLVENCPWCNTKSYYFSNLPGWGCMTCDYTLGADLFGGRYS